MDASTAGTDYRHIRQERQAQCNEPMKQREQKPNLFGLCRVATEEGEANAAWGGQWDAKEIMISMGAHATTENLNDCPDFTVAFATKRTIHNLAVLIAERCAPKSQDFVDYWTHKTGKNAPSREIFLQKE